MSLREEYHSRPKFAKQLDEHEADIETAELLSGEPQKHIFGDSKEEQALRWRNFKGMEENRES